MHAHDLEERDERHEQPRRRHQRPDVAVARGRTRRQERITEAFIRFWDALDSIGVSAYFPLAASERTASAWPSYSRTTR